MLSLSREAAEARYAELIGSARGDHQFEDEITADLGRADLYFLLVYLLNRQDLRDDWLYARCREVQADPNGHLDIWAREHYKSTIITFGLTIQDILNNPEITVGIFSHTRSIAKGFLVQIKREFELNETLKGLYPKILYQNPAKESPKWSEDQGLIVQRSGNPKEATIEAWGLVDGQPTAKHFSLRVYDDTVTLESVSTPEQVDKTTRAWEMSDNLGTHGGAVRYIGTRYALLDTYATIMERGVVKTRIHPATDNGRLDGAPVLMDAKTWAEKKKLQSSTLAAQLLCNPLAGTDVIFKANWLRPWEVRSRTLNVYIMGDPSKGRSATSDRTAILVVGLAQGGAKYLLDGYCHRMTLSERWTNLKALWDRWARRERGVLSVSVGWEQYGLQTDLEYFEERQRIENCPFAIKELNWVREGLQSKKARIGRLEPDFRDGHFFLPGVVWHEAYGGAALWSIENEKVKYRELSGPTSAMKRATESGAADTVCQALKRVDEEKRIYDVTRYVIEELLTVPYGVHDDAADALSRMYDMEAVEPNLTAEREAAEYPLFYDT